MKEIAKIALVAVLISCMVGMITGCVEYIEEYNGTLIIYTADDDEYADYTVTPNYDYARKFPDKIPTGVTMVIRPYVAELMRVDLIGTPYEHAITIVIEDVSNNKPTGARIEWSIQTLTNGRDQDYEKELRTAISKALRGRNRTETIEHIVTGHIEITVSKVGNTLSIYKHHRTGL